MKDHEVACRFDDHLTSLVDRFEAVERVVTRRDNPYRTVLAERDIDPPIGRMLTHHLALGGGVGFLAAGLASIWLFLIASVTQENNGAALIIIVAPIAAICGAIVGAASAVLLGLVLWPTLALRLGRFAYPATAGIIQGRIMYFWAFDAFESDTASATVVWVGSAVIAVVLASRWTGETLVQLSRSSYEPTN